jgi:hypothetical protein
VLYSDDSLRLAGHLRVGNTAAPANTAAGDLTLGRLNIGNGGFSTGQVLRVTTAVTGDVSAWPNYLFASFNPTNAGSYDHRTLEAEAEYLGAVNNTSMMAAGAFYCRFTGAGTVSYAQALYGTAVVASNSNPMSVGTARALCFQLFSGSGSRTVNTISVSSLSGVRIEWGSAPVAGDAFSNVYGLNVGNLGGAQRTNVYGAYIAGQSGAATLNVGVYVGDSGTVALWLAGDAGVTSGVMFGSARDTNLYRSAANILKTDDAFHVGADFRHLGANLGFYNAAAVAQQTITGSRGGNAAVASIATALANLGLVIDATTP